MNEVDWWLYIGVAIRCRTDPSAMITTNARAVTVISAGTKTSSWATEEPAPAPKQLRWAAMIAYSCRLPILDASVDQR